jgi:hypothetical protein
MRTGTKLTNTKIELIDVADLDVIFLTYDEPRKDEFWVKLKNTVPWARRVDGVKGSDAAHKAAANASTTDRFILVDGDNIPDPEFFNLQLAIDDGNRSCVFRWRARNNINGLMYGNGGISSWSKVFVERMQTHEASNGSPDTAVEFCFHKDYWAMHDCYSTTYPDATPFQAWRAGFREGVKMCLDQGRRLDVLEFQDGVHRRNYDNLCIWQSVGADNPNGFWAIYGARLGTEMTMLTDWDYTDVQDFSKLEHLWQDFKDHGPDECNKVGTALRKRLGLDIIDMDPDESRFFKHHYRSNFRNQGIMKRDQ